MGGIMRVMTRQEMEDVIRRCNWATICTVTPEGFPYAIEATPFHMDGCHCFMINPRGVTWKNMLENHHVLLKYTLAHADLSVWAGVSCFGAGEFVFEAATVREGWRLLGRVMGADYSRAAGTFAGLKDRSPLFRVRVEEMTGRCSAAKEGALDLGSFGKGSGGDGTAGGRGRGASVSGEAV